MSFLLSDCGYACRSYLLKPFFLPQTEKGNHHNAAHSKFRSVSWGRHGAEPPLWCWGSGESVFARSISTTLFQKAKKEVEAKQYHESSTKIYSNFVQIAIGVELKTLNVFLQYWTDYILVNLWYSSLLLWNDSICVARVMATELHFNARLVP